MPQVMFNFAIDEAIRCKKKMSIRQKKVKASIFVDYVPAELRENKRWEVIYYVKNPFTKKLVRKANRVKPMKSITERRKLGRQMVKNINAKLHTGWNPFRTTENSDVFRYLFDEMDSFIARKKLEHKKGNLRFDTLRSYKSFVRNIKVFFTDCAMDEMAIFDFTTFQINEYLDNIYYEKENSARTRNNHLSFIRTLFTYFMSRKFIDHNPADLIKPMKNIKKDKKIIPQDIRSKIKSYLTTKNPNYLTLCLACYYCLIRRTELTRLRVSDVVLSQRIIYVKNENSKTKKSQAVTIPDSFMPYLIKHLSKANNNDFLFSARNFSAGPDKLAPKEISDYWDKIRTRAAIPREFKWYHLKDSGITELLSSGIPSIKVRDQARHYSITQTEEYTPKEIIRAVSEIQQNQVSF